MGRREERISRRQRRAKNRVTIRTLFLLAITLIFNTYAWFLYVTTVSGNLTAHVDAWNVAFEVDNQVVQQEFNFQIAHAYPGMANASRTITVINNGEKQVQLNYEIKSARILGDTYVSTEAIASGYIAPQGAIQMSAANLLSKVQNDYPFTVSFTGPQQAIGLNSSGTLTITFSWPYESGNDILDTSYGTQAYTYYQTNPTSPAIEILIKIIAEQPNS